MLGAPRSDGRTVKRRCSGRDRRGSNPFRPVVGARFWACATPLGRWSVHALCVRVGVERRAALNGPVVTSQLVLSRLPIPQTSALAAHAHDAARHHSPSLVREVSAVRGGIEGGLVAARGRARCDRQLCSHLHPCAWFIVRSLLMVVTSCVRAANPSAIGSSSAARQTRCASPRRQLRRHDTRSCHTRLPSCPHLDPPLPSASPNTFHAAPTDRANAETIR